MRRSRDVALHASFYLAVALSGLAAAYILRRWGHRLRDPRRALPDPNDKKSEPSADVEAPTLDPDTDHDTRQTKSLPPLRTHSLPPPLPNAQALLSGSFVSIGTPSTTSGGQDGLNEEGAAQTNASDESDSFIDLLSPAPTHVVSRRRSMRAIHDDLFAESHISFAELGSLVAPQDESK